MRGALLPLGSRSFDIVETLVRSNGQLVTKRDLMRQIWPDAVIEENTLQVHISAVRRALGPNRGLLKTESGRGYRLLGDWTVRNDAAITPLADVAQAKQQSRPIRSNLPSTTEPLVGRSGAIERLRHLLSAYRAVTLTGPGGIGKTVLALEAARDLLPGFVDGIWFVELAPLSDGTLMPSSIASLLGLSLVGDVISAEVLARGIADRSVLLILDNCEHLIDQVARVADAIIRLCPNVTLFATSRETLRIDGEYAFRVPPLDVPDLGRMEARDLLGHSAVELFVAKARALDASFVPSGGSLSTIASICRHLDGMPLAIEFAASRAATLGIEYVAQGLGDRFALLTSGRRTALPRHRTLRATLDWSYDLLPEAERCALRHLAIFAGSFTAEAAVSVASDTPFSAETLVEAVANLVAKSLITFEGSTGPSRWRLLETIRAYAYGKLLENGEFEAAALRHAEYHGALFSRARSDWERQPTAAWLAEYGYRLDDLRATIDWAFSPAGDLVRGLNLVVDAVPLWMQLSLMAECRQRVEQALSRVAEDTAENDRLRMRLWTALGLSRMYTGEPLSEIEATWNTALHLAEQVGDADYQRRAKWGLFASSFNRGQFRAALELAEQFYEISSDPNEKLVGERLVGTALLHLGDLKGARRHIEHMLAAYSAPVTSSHLIRYQNDQVIAARRVLSPILWLQGYPDQAMQMIEQAVADAQSLDHALTLCNLLAQAACPVALLAGDLDAARRFTRLLMATATRHSLHVWAAYGKCFEGSLIIADGRVEDGLKRMREGGDVLREASFFQNYAPYLGLLAEALGVAGNAASALATIDEALAHVERTGERWCLAELQRVKGEINRRNGNAVAAETWFRQALTEASQQDALSWELRAASSLARLRSRQGHRDEARGILAPVYERFTEGFQTADLRAAKALLDSWCSDITG